MHLLQDDTSLLETAWIGLELLLHNINSSHLSIHAFPFLIVK